MSKRGAPVGASRCSALPRRSRSDATDIPASWIFCDGGPVGALVERLGVPQPKVSNHLACLRWCGFIEARREHRTVFNQIADKRVVKMLDLA